MENNIMVRGVTFTVASYIYSFLRGFILIGGYLAPRFVPGYSGNIAIVGPILGSAVILYFAVTIVFSQLYLKTWISKIYGEVPPNAFQLFSMAFWHFLSVKNNKGYSIKYGLKGSRYNVYLTPNEDGWQLREQKTGEHYMPLQLRSRVFQQYSFEGLFAPVTANDSFYILLDDDESPYIVAEHGIGRIVLLANKADADSATKNGYSVGVFPRKMLPEIYSDAQERETYIELNLGSKGGDEIFVYSGDELLNNQRNDFFGINRD